VNKQETITLEVDGEKLSEESRGFGKKTKIQVKMQEKGDDGIQAFYKLLIISDLCKYSGFGRNALVVCKFPLI
jgi:hypothetical protein